MELKKSNYKLLEKRLTLFDCVKYGLSWDDVSCYCKKLLLHHSISDEFEVTLMPEHVTHWWETIRD